MNNIQLIAKKEWTDILRSKTFVYMVALLIFLTILSLSVSFLVFNAQVSEYHNALEFLKKLGKIPTTAMPTLYPLNLLRGVVDYIEIIGAILGIILGYISISKERNTKALKLILSRAVSKKEVALGKLLGNGLFIFLLMSMISIVVFLEIYLIGGVVLNGVEILKLSLFVLFSTFYIMIFFMLSFLLSLQQKNINQALIFSFVVWLVFVLIFPQIGDTMDPDNQVPGGFFKSMNITRVKSKEIMKKFNNYEVIRGGIEQLSITKHYEREMFALFGIKSIYNDMPLTKILSKNINNTLFILFAFIFAYILSYIILIKNKNYLGE
ncbi:MAG: ABC transporter permease subunit [Epsilonproteobacteria bacterium]|nr:ABC transporter permease subunit [Campylobacterota bacterium]